MSNQLDLSKKLKTTLNLTKGISEIPVMAVFQAVDASGSMSNLYRNKFVDKLLTVASAAALTFDDNGSLQIGFFSNSLTETDEITADTNLDTYLSNQGVNAWGGTSFMPVFKWFDQTAASGYETKTSSVKKAAGFFGRLFGKSEVVEETASAAPEDLPKFMILISDGRAQDQGKFKQAISKLDGLSYIMVIGLGSQVDEDYWNELAGSTQQLSFTQVDDPTDYDQDKLLDIISNDDKFIAFVKKL